MKRILLWLSVALLVSPGLDARQSARTKPKPGNQPEPTLRQLADQLNFKIGATISPTLLGQPGYREVLGREYNSAEAPTFFRSIQPFDGRFHFAEFDRDVDFARENKMTLFGAPLIYKKETLPDWMNRWFWFESDLDDTMGRHITTVVSRGGDIFSAWEVVNEPLTTENAPFGHKWSRVEYISRAFRYARAASPNGVLLLNQSFGRSGVESNLAQQYFSLFGRLRAMGVPVDAAGIEMHLEMQMMRPSYLDEFKDFLARAEHFGITVYVTEMDVYQGPPGTSSDPWGRQKQIYHDVLAACLASPVCKAYYTWGLTDAHNMYENRVRDPHPDAKPLPFDANYQKKPAYYGLLEALQERVATLHAAAPPKTR